MIITHLASDWVYFDYYFGAVKGDNFLVIWHNKTEVLKACRSFGAHKELFRELSETFNQYIDNEIIKKASFRRHYNDFPARTPKYMIRLGFGKFKYRL